MEGTPVKNKFFGTFGALALAGVLAAVALSGCSSTSNWIAAAMRALGTTPGTIYNFGQDGQEVYSAHCRSMDFGPDHMFDTYNAKGEKTGDSSVIQVTCGDGVVRTVGFSTVYVSDSAQGALVANSQAFYKLRVQNNDRSIPLLVAAWANVKRNFVGTDSVAQICDQWNNPIMAFAGTVNGFATDVTKSTMFQITYGPDNHQTTGYIWASRVSYTTTPTSLLNQAA